MRDCARLELTISIQQRDIVLFRGLFESRIMTSAQIASVYFGGSGDAAKQRIRKLKAGGFLGERKRRVFERSILFLTPKALKLLGEQGILKEYPPISLNSLVKRSSVSELTLRHELSVMDVKAAFYSSMRSKADFRIAEFTTWPALCQFEACPTSFGAGEITVKPDGFIRIQELENDKATFESSFFFELDRSSETLDTLVSRGACYMDHFRSGGFAVKNGGIASDFKKFPFRVLMVFRNAERRNNIAERFLQSRQPITKLVYLSTFDEVKADPLGRIWIRPLEYREASKGTPFEPKGQVQTWGYKRQTAREIFVESNIRKCSILEDADSLPTVENVSPRIQ